jgi:hypothetical protein
MGDVDEASDEDAPPFDCASLDFERGVEFGLLFARVKDYGRIEGPVHADLAEQVIRLAEQQRLPFSGEAHEHDVACEGFHDDSEWLYVRIGPREAA